jgi:hypothetical protein
VRFFLSGVEEAAKQAGQTAKALMKLAAADERRIQAIGKCELISLMCTCAMRS